MFLARASLIAVFASAPLAAQDPSPPDRATPVSASPIADGHSDFNLLDIDRDGWLSESELKTHPDDVWEFTVVDRDGDGKISSDEWARRDEDERGYE